MPTSALARTACRPLPEKAKAEAGALGLPRLQEMVVLDQGHLV